MSKKQTMRLSLITAAVLVVLLCLVGVFALNVSNQSANASWDTPNYVDIDGTYSIDARIDYDDGSNDYTEWDYDPSETLLFDFGTNVGTIIDAAFMKGSDAVTVGRYYAAKAGDDYGPRTTTAPTHAGEYKVGWFDSEIDPYGELDDQSALAEIKFSIGREQVALKIPQSTYYYTGAAINFACAVDDANMQHYDDFVAIVSWENYYELEDGAEFLSDVEYYTQQTVTTHTLAVDGVEYNVGDHYDPSGIKLYTKSTGAPILPGIYYYYVNLALKEGTTTKYESDLPDYFCGREDGVNSITVDARQLDVTIDGTVPYTGEPQCVATVSYVPQSTEEITDPTILDSYPSLLGAITFTPGASGDIGAHVVSVEIKAQYQECFYFLDGGSNHVSMISETQIIEKAPSDFANEALSIGGAAGFGDTIMCGENNYWGSDTIADRIVLDFTKVPGYEGLALAGEPDWSYTDSYCDNDSAANYKVWTVLGNFDKNDLETYGANFTVRVKITGNTNYEEGYIYLPFTVDKAKYFVRPDYDLDGDTTTAYDDATSLTYTATAQKPLLIVYQYKIGIKSTSLGIVFSDATTSQTNVGTYDMAIEFLGNHGDDKEFVADEGAKFTITAAVLDPSLTLAAYSLEYGTAANATLAGVNQGDMLGSDEKPSQGITEVYYYRYSATNPADWEAINWTEAVSNGAFTEVKNVGYYQLKYDFVCEGTTEGGYINYASNGASIVNVIVTKKHLTLTVENKETTYGEAAPAFTVSSTDFAYGETPAVLGGTPVFTCAYNIEDANNRAATPYTISVTGYTSDNYEIDQSNTGTLTVNPRPVTYTVVAKSSTYGDALVGCSATLTTGDLASWDESVNISYALYEVYDDSDPDKDNWTIIALTGTSPVGEYDIVAIDNDSNYDITIVNTVKYTITNATLTVDLAPSANDLYYNGNPQTPTINKTISSVNSQAITYKYSKTYDADGTDYVDLAEITYTNVADSGTLYYYYTAPNHNATAGSFTVTMNTVNATWTAPTAKSLTYNKTAQALVNAPTDVVGGEVKYSTDNGESWGSDVPVATGADVYNVLVKVVPDGNHNANLSVTVPVTIQQKEITISGITAADKTYDGNTTATLSYTNVTFGGIEEGDSLSIAATGTFEDKNVAYEDSAVVAKNVSITGLTLGGTSIANYKLAESGQQSATTAKINPKEITVTVGETYSVYGNAIEAVASASITSGSLVAGDDDPWGYTAAYSALSQDSTVAEGTGVEILVCTDPNYAINFAGDNTYEIKKATYSIATSYYGYNNPFDGASHTVTDNKSALPDGVTAAFYVDNYEAGEHNATNTLFTGATNVGTYYVEVRFSGDAANYNAIPSVYQTIIITQRVVTVTLAGDITAQALVYNGAAKTVTGTYYTWANGAETDETAAATVSLKAGDDNVNVGEFTVTVSIEDDNYAVNGDDTHTFTITQAKDTELTTAIAVANVTYNGDEKYLITTAGVAKYGATVKYRIGDEGEGTTSADAIKGTNVGSYDIYYTIVGTDNYVGVDWTLAGTAKINAAAAVITADPQGIADLVYTGAPIVLVTDGTAVGGSFMYKVDSSAWVTAANAKAENAGTHTIVYKVVGDENHSDLVDEVNYTFTVTIGKATAVVNDVTAADLVYNGDDQVLLDADEAYATFGEIEYSLDEEEGWVTDYTEITGWEAGDYTVYYRVVGNDNYYGAQGNIDVTIAKKTIVVSADADNKTYDGTTNVTFSNIVADGRIDMYDEEDLIVVIEGAFANADAGNSKTVTITAVTLTGDSADYYELSTEEGLQVGSELTANIEKKNIAGATITLADQTLTYNGQEQTRNVVSVYAGTLEVGAYIVNGDKATNAGNHTLTVTVPVESNFTGSATETWSIAKKALTIKADNKNVNFGSGKPTLTWTATGFVNNETTAVLGDTNTIAFTCDYEPEAPDYIDAYTDIDINIAGSVTAVNYEIGYAKGTLSVVEAPLTINVNDATVEYGSDPAGAGYDILGIPADWDFMYDDEECWYTFGGYNKATAAVGDQFQLNLVVDEFFDEDSNCTIAQINSGLLTVVQKNVSSGITIEVGALTYNGAVQTIEIIVKYGDIVMVEGTDYTVEDNSATAAGNYELCIHGIGNYTGNKTAEWSIAPKPITVVNVNEEHLEMVYGDAETLQTIYPAAYIGLKDGFALAEGDTLAGIIAVSVDVNGNPVQSLDDVWNVNKYYLHVYDEFDEIKYNSNYTVTVELDEEAYLEIVKRPITIAYTKNEKVQIVFDPGAYIEYELASLVMENYSLFELIEGTLADGDNDLSGVITIYSEEFEAFIETIEADFSNYFKVLGTYAIDVKDEQGNYEITLVEDANCAFEIVERPLYVVPADGQSKIYGEVDGEIVYVDLLTDNWTYDNEKQEWVCKRETIFKGNAPVAPVAPVAPEKPNIPEQMDAPNPEDYDDEDAFDDAEMAYWIWEDTWEDYYDAVAAYENALEDYETELANYNTELARYEAEIAEYRALIFGLLEGNLGRVEGENAGAYAITIGNLHFKALPAEPVAQPVYDEYVANLPEEPVEPEEPAEPAELEAYAQAYAEWLEQYDAAMAEYNVAVAAYQEYGALVGYKAFYELRIDEVAKYYTIGAKAITVTAADKTSVYGENFVALTATDNGIVAGDAANTVYTLTKAAGNTVGTYAITVNAVANDNYVVTGVPAVYTITAKAITVTAANKTSVYGDAIVALTATADLVGDDAASDVYTLTKAAGNNVGTYAITVNVANNANYVVTAVNGTYTITKKAITFSVYADGVPANGNDATVVYDGQAHTFVIKALGAGNEIITIGEVDSLTVVTGVESTVEAGDYAADGVQAKNYVLAQNATFTYAITPKPIDAIVYKIDGVVRNSVEYDGQDHSVIAYATDVEGNLFGIGGGPGKEAGSYTVTVEAGSYNDNYALAETATFAWSITEKAAVVDPETGAKDYAKEISDKDAASDTGVNVTELFKKADSEKTDDVESEVTITIKSGEGEEAKTGTIVFDKAAIAQLAGAADVALKINVTSDVEEIAEIVTVKETLKGAEMVINVSLGNATFETGKATLTFDFDKQAPKGMIGKVYYVDADGNRTDMKATFANGKVTFEATHFSDYIVVFEKAPGLSGGAIAGIVIACVVVAAGIAVGIFFLLKKKKGNGGSATTAGEAAATETAAE